MDTDTEAEAEPETAAEQIPNADDGNDETQLAGNEYYFPDVRVQSGGRLGLDTSRMKRYGFEVDDRVDVALPDLELFVPDVTIQTQFRVQIPSRLREKYGIEQGESFDTFVIERTEEAEDA